MCQTSPSPCSSHCLNQTHPASSEPDSSCSSWVESGDKSSGIGNTSDTFESWRRPTGKTWISRCLSVVWALLPVRSMPPLMPFEISGMTWLKARLKNPQSGMMGALRLRLLFWILLALASTVLPAVTAAQAIAQLTQPVGVPHTSALAERINDVPSESDSARIVSIGAFAGTIARAGAGD